MTDDSDRPSVPPRAMTPYEGWSGISKLPAAKPAIDPLSSVALLFPRDPRAPMSVSEFERASQDTDRSPPLRESDDTPIRTVLSPMDQLCLDVSEMRETFKEFQKGFVEMRDHCRDAANNSLQTLAVTQKLAGEVKALEKRMTAVELSERWVPRAVWLVTFLISLFALARTYIHR